jgi:uncharacterized protein (DUF2384 family)
VARAERVLQDPVRALKWCRSPQEGLGRETPFEVMDTDMGGSAVRTLLEDLERRLQDEQ